MKISILTSNLVRDFDKCLEEPLPDGFSTNQRAIVEFLISLCIFENKMPPVKGNFRNYTPEAMTFAIKDVRENGTPISTAAKKFGVPRITLKYKVEGKSPVARKMGPDPILSSLEENVIRNWIFKMASSGFLITMDIITLSVQRFLKDLERPNPFRDDRPGRTWIKCFMRRNPEVSQRIGQNLTSTRSTVTMTNIYSWFQEVEKYFFENNLSEILEDPSRIFNTDETAFFLNPKGNRILAKKRDKTVYQQVNTGEKECVTVLVTGSAIGVVAPTTVIYKYKRIPSEIVKDFPEEWGIGKTDSGWMTCEAFYEFVANVFYPWLLKEKITLPVVLFMDVHLSNISLHTSQFCESHGIVLVALYPNATHLLQPMDVAVFRPLKEGWKKRVHKWRVDNIINPNLKKSYFAKLLKEVIEDVVTENVLVNGFRKCGLYPWNHQAIIIENESVDSKKMEERKNYLIGVITYFNENIEVEKLDAFRANEESDYNLDERDKSLFAFWRKLKDELTSLESNI